jgi:hypothetical protein
MLNALRFRFLISLPILALLALLAVGAAAQTAPGAQTAAGDWAEPVNLSRSGRTAQPLLLVDAAGTAHAFWQDAAAGYVYSHNRPEPDEATADGWLLPQRVELPFGSRRYFPDLRLEAATPLFRPTLLATPDGRIHAFWLDDERALFYSSVPASDVADFSAWSGRERLAETAVALAVAPGERLHLAYLRPRESTAFPAGVYYRSLAAGGDWTAPVQLYRSPYFFGLAGERAHLRLAAVADGDDEQVVVAWDNRPLERVFLAVSADGGQSWGEPQVIDERRPGDRPDSAGPSHLLIDARPGQILLLWQAGHGTETCRQYYQLSHDGGVTWQAPELLPEPPAACAQANRFLPGGDLPLLWSTTADATYLLAWDGRRWSDPQRQPALDRLVNPATYRPLDFACRQPVAAAGTLLLLGCDDNGKDVWLTSRPLGGLTDWFPPPPPEPVWSPAQVLVESERAPAEIRLLAAGDGRFHAFWVETGANVVQYARGGSGLEAVDAWSRPAPVLSVPESGPVAGFAVAADAVGRLLAVWSGQTSGELYFSWANAARATAASEWTSPQRLPALRLQAAWPDLALDRGGTIHVAYTIPVNEERGIYLVQSEDGGAGWSQPIPVFDGVAAGWEMVGRPRLAAGPHGRLYLLWTRQALPAPEAGETRQTSALYYATSEDGGLTWSEADEVVQAAVLWREIVVWANGDVLRLWAEAAASGEPQLWYQESNDGGSRWGRPLRVAGIGAAGVAGHANGPAALTRDGAGRLHLVQLQASGEAVAGLQLQQWLWQDERWQAQGRELLAGAGLDGALMAGGALAAAADDSHRLAVLYAAAGAEETRHTLNFSSRLLEEPAELPEPEPTITPRPTQTPLPPPTATPPPTPTPVFPREADQSGGLPVSLGSGYQQIDSLVAVVPAGIIVLLVVLLGLRARRRG